jgi:hypothetical protein
MRDTLEMLWFFASVLLLLSGSLILVKLALVTTLWVLRALNCLAP